MLFRASSVTSTCYLKTDALEVAVRFLADKGFLAVSVIADDSLVVVSILTASEEDRRVLGDLLDRSPVTQFALLVKRADWIRSGGTVEPDYRSLVELLPNLRRVPDALALPALRGSCAKVADGTRRTQEPGGPRHRRRAESSALLWQWQHLCRVSGKPASPFRLAG